MESRPIYDYIFLGTALQYLQDCQSGSRVRDNDGTGPYTLEHLALFLSELDRFGLRVTAASAWQLREIQAELATIETKTLTVDEAQRLQDAIHLVRHTLEAEAQITRAFVVTEKRIEVGKLLDDVGALMPPSIFAKTSALAQHDLSAAGRAIAFELPTAAAFHVLRATEDVLRHVLSVCDSPGPT
jgi:hypothetical protein